MFQFFFGNVRLLSPRTWLEIFPSSCLKHLIVGHGGKCPNFFPTHQNDLFFVQGLLLKISSGVTLPNVEMLRSHATNIQWFHTSKCLLLTNTNVHVSVVLLKHRMPTFLPWRLGRQSPVKKSWNLESVGTFSALRFCEE